METVLIIIVILICWLGLKKKITDLQIKVGELKVEIRRQHNYSTQSTTKEKTAEVKEEIIKTSPVVAIKEEKEEDTNVEVKNEDRWRNIQKSEIVEPPLPEEEPEVKQEEEPGEEIIVMPPLITPKPIPEKPFTPVVPKKVNYEKYIGENLFGKIGILILVAGIGFFVKYAIDNNWINETMRTILGFVCGICLLFVAERLKKQYRTFSSLLAGGAFAVFYVTVAIAYHYYRIFSQPVAFAILIIITILMSALAVFYDRRELAVIALIGGFIAPFLVSSGEGNYKVLFSYILILNMGMFLLSFIKKWSELPVITFVFTTIVMALYIVSNHFSIVPVTNIPSSALPVNMFIFATLFYFIFLLPLLFILKSEKIKINQMLLLIVVINNFTYLAFGLYFIWNMHLSFKADGILPLFIALVNTLLLLWLRKEKQDYRLLINTTLGIIIVFVTIAIPIQLDGEMITLLWASEMIVLVWFYIKTRIRLYESFSVALIAFTMLSFFSDVVHCLYLSTIPSSYFITHLYIGVSFLAVALLMEKYKETFNKAVILRYRPWNTLLITIAAIIIYYVIAREITQQVSSWEIMLKSHILFLNSYLLLFAVCFQKMFSIKKNPSLYYLILMVNVLLFAADSYLITLTPASGSKNVILSWAIVLVTILTFAEIGRQYYKIHTKRSAQKDFTIYFTLLATVCWVCLQNVLFHQLGITKEGSAGFSIALSLAGFIQMALGMRLHFKVLRKFSLTILSIVLLKLVLIDLWALPTVGKIIVFIFLGITLLILSFLYQKLKNVLFKEDEEE